MKTYLLLFLSVIALTECSTARHHSKVSQELRQKAPAMGMVRAIVGLDIPVHPEKTLSPQTVMKQRQAITKAQSDLIAELSGTKHEVGSRMTPVPTIALKVGPDALTILERSERVKKVTEDRVLNPL